MKINELNLDGYKHIKNNDWELPANLINWLQDNNFDKIGSGKYSHVYSSNTENFVVKINKGYIDKEYIEFVDYCHKNKNNPHLPKIGKIKKYDDWYIIFIEKLQKRDIEYIGISKYDFFSKMKLLTQAYMMNDENYIEEIWNNITETYTNANKQLKDIAKLMADIIKKCNNITIFNFDLHDENIMLRDNTIVITDPLYDGT